jgi:hypothetical protein
MREPAGKNARLACGRTIAVSAGKSKSENARVNLTSQLILPI